MFQFVMAPLITCQPFAHSYAYQSALLALWLARHMRARSGWLLAAVLALYGGPLTTLFRAEVRERCAFAVARRAAARTDGSTRGGRGASAGRAAAQPEVDWAKLRARIDAEPWAPAEFLLPAVLGACSACL